MSKLKYNYPLWLELINHSRIPLKFAYLDEGADRHNKLVESTSYKIPSAERQLIDTFLSSCEKYFLNEPINIIELGCGNGKKTKQVVDFFLNYQNSIDILLIDISERMIEIAKRNILRNGSPKLISKELIDFENDDLKRVIHDFTTRTSYQNLILFLGNTLGNSFDKVSTIQNIAKSISSKDFLLLGVELFNYEHIESIISQYETEVFREAVSSALEKLDVNPNDGRLNIEFDYKNQDVLVWFELQKPISIRMTFGDIHFLENQRILLMVSHKFTDSEIKKLLNISGLKDVQVYSNKSNQHSLYLCNLT
jgi:L-histidine Nalpha-methyltransferase